MLDGFKPKRRHVKDIPLAPVLDLLTVVVFFLLLSTSFDELRQSEVPPSMIAKMGSSPSASLEVPLNPKILIGKAGPGKINILLRWTGKIPGQKQRQIANDEGQYNTQIKDITKDLANEFFKQYPNEKSIQLGFTGQITFQTVLSCLDGILLITKDIALLSFQETENLFAGRDQ